MEIDAIFQRLGLEKQNPGSCTGSQWGTTHDKGEIQSVSPIHAEHLASVLRTSSEDYETMMQKAMAAFNA